MRRSDVLFYVGLVLLAGCTVRCNTGGNLDMDKARTFVSEGIKDYTGLAPTKVSCPEEVKGEKGGKVVCTFEVGGVPGAITMVQNDDKGTITVSSMTGIIASSKLETLIQDELKKRDAAADVDCGARVHPSKPGDVLTCDVRQGQTVVARASVTITDEENHLTFKIEQVSP